MIRLVLDTSHAWHIFKHDADSKSLVHPLLDYHGYSGDIFLLTAITIKGIYLLTSSLMNWIEYIIFYVSNHFTHVNGHFMNFEKRIIAKQD